MSDVPIDKYLKYLEKGHMGPDDIIRLLEEVFPCSWSMG